MGNILNVGARSLLVNQKILETVGNNIANVNTPGYSRQTVAVHSVEGQFSGGGYYGNGVDITTVQRSYSDFLTKQAALMKSVAAADASRYDKLQQLEGVFSGGTDGLGASVSDLLNSFSDIVNAPSDLTARSVTLTSADEMASRFQTAANQLYELRLGTTQQLQADVKTINSLATQIAKANQEIARATGSGHTPNDLLDQRDQLINELNKYIQTTSVATSDGAVNVFVAGSQSLVMGASASTLQVGATEFSADASQVQLTISSNGAQLPLNESMLGGGEVAGLLRFQNQDLGTAGNLLGRMALAIGTRMNEQQALGLDLNGNPGSPLFTMASIPVGYPSDSNTPPGTTLSIGIQTSPASGTTQFVASDYEVQFTSGTAGTIVRLSDGTSTAFDFGVTNPVQIDGLEIQQSATPATAGDRFLLKPFSTAAGSITTAFSSPRGLAMASPVAASGGASNTGTLAVASLTARSMPAPPAVTLNFTSASTYTRSDTGATVYTYTPGQPIEYSTAPPLTGWSLTLKGTPQPGDTYSVQPNAYPALNAGNAQSMLNLRDLAMFDGGPLTDGYAGLMAEIGIQVQSAKSAATVSENIAANIEQQRTSVSGVNLDEEAARMLQYQQAYQASGKMLQLAQNIFETLLQSLGR
jgi:flagellar hook-associated protein 1 FlgK